MDEIKFAIKTFAASLALIAFMQIKIGSTTVESKAYQVLAKSKISSFLNDVAHGVVILGNQTKEKIENIIKHNHKPSAE